MKKIQHVLASEGVASDRYLAPTCSADAPVTSRRVSPEDVSLWLVASTLPAATTLEWDAPHGDEALYVRAGALEVAGRVCPRGGVVVVESGVATRAVSKGATQLLHMGPRDPQPSPTGLHGPAEPEGHRVHVVGPRGTFEQLDDQRETRFFADSSCPTCRLWLLYTSRNFSFESRIHSHSQDELIHVLQGEVELGSLRVGPGSTLFIAADQLYRFRAGAAGFAFLNYRRDASRMRFQGEEKTLVEAGRATGMQPVADLY